MYRQWSFLPLVYHFQHISFQSHLNQSKEITGKFPGYLSPSAGLKFADVPNGLAAISKVPAAGWGQILAYMAFCEVSQDQSAGTPAAAGDFGFKVLTASDPAEKTKKLNAELANGRLAMMAIIGMFFQAFEAVENKLSQWCVLVLCCRVSNNWDERLSHKIRNNIEKSIELLQELSSRYLWGKTSSTLIEELHLAVFGDDPSALQLY